MKIVPPSNFRERYREAIKTYEKAFLGKLTCLITYRESSSLSMPLRWETQLNHI